MLNILIELGKSSNKLPLIFFVICMADIIVSAFEQAIKLMASGNPEVYATVYRSIYIAGVGTLLSCVWSIPIAVALGLYNFRGKWVIKGIFNALIGIPTVALGLILFLLFYRQGELGSLHLTIHSKRHSSRPSNTGYPNNSELHIKRFRHL